MVPCLLALCHGQSTSTLAYMVTAKAGTSCMVCFDGSGGCKHITSSKLRERRGEYAAD